METAPSWGAGPDGVPPSHTHRGLLAVCGEGGGSGPGCGGWEPGRGLGGGIKGVRGCPLGWGYTGRKAEPPPVLLKELRGSSLRSLPRLGGCRRSPARPQGLLLGDISSGTSPQGSSAQKGPQHPVCPSQSGSFPVVW